MAAPGTTTADWEFDKFDDGSLSKDNDIISNQVANFDPCITGRDVKDLF